MLIKASSSDNGQVKTYFKGIEGTAFRHIQFIINKSKMLGDGGHIIQALLNNCNGKIEKFFEYCKTVREKLSTKSSLCLAHGHPWPPHPAPSVVAWKKSKIPPTLPLVFFPLSFLVVESSAIKLVASCRVARSQKFQTKN